MNKSFFAIIAMLLTLTACSTPYKRYSNTLFQLHSREGYSDYQIDENTFSVSVRVLEDSKALLFGYALRRAAEVTLKNGGTHFVILNQKQDTQIERYYTDNTTLVLSYPDVTIHIRTYKENPPHGAYHVAELVPQQTTT